MNMAIGLRMVTAARLGGAVVSWEHVRTKIVLCSGWPITIYIAQPPAFVSHRYENSRGRGAYAPFILRGGPQGPWAGCL
jgi:hypothetical protein